jgi:cytosine/adenosine deaminase-related metal-dependent hydrolase
MTESYFIKNATVVSVDPAIGVVDNCNVLIKDGIIVAVATDAQPLSDSIVIDGTDAIVSPGFVDTHRHTWQTQLRTTTADYVLLDYVINIRSVWGSCYTAHDAYIGNYCGALESLDNGITFLIDHSHIMNSPEHADAAVKGLKDSNIRAVFCYGLFENPFWPGSVIDTKLAENNPHWRLDDAKRIKETYFKSNTPTDLLRFGFAPAEIERGTLQQSIEEVQFGRSLNSAVITGHIAMGKYDRGAYIVRNFNERNLLGPDLLFSHCATLADDELEAVRKHGVSLSSTPDTELQMGMGHPIAFKARDRGCCASIGIDITSNNPADMFQQMRLLIQSQRHLENESHDGPLPGVRQRCAEVLEMATMGGAEAVGLKDVIGSISPGKRADLLITRCDSTRLTPVHDPIAALVLYANASDIDTVFVNGKIVKSKGKLVGVDWPKVRSELRDSANAIMERSKKAPMKAIKEATVALMNAEAHTGVPKIHLKSSVAL